MHFHFHRSHTVLKYIGHEQTAVRSRHGGTAWQVVLQRCQRALDSTHTALAALGDALAGLPVPILYSATTQGIATTRTVATAAAAEATAAVQV